MLREIAISAALGIGSIAFANDAPDRTVRYSGDYGCNTYQDQADRLAATKIVMQASMLKAQGRESRESKAISDMAAHKAVEISNTKCRPLNGVFKVLGRQKIDGGNVVKIRFDESTTLWVLGD